MVNGNWGKVKIVNGRYKGKKGYYDNDEIISNGQDRAVVYLDGKSDYVLISHDYIKRDNRIQLDTTLHPAFPT